MRPIAPGEPDWDQFVVALVASSLPVADLMEARQSFFAFDREDGAPAYGGFVLYGEDALLRSVVVPQYRRGRGLGRKIVLHLLGVISAAGAARTWLLTSGAERFFERLGFQAAARDLAPASIRGSHAFARLCPSSAVLMCRTLP